MMVHGRYCGSVSVLCACWQYVYPLMDSSTFIYWTSPFVILEVSERCINLGPVVQN